MDVVVEILRSRVRRTLGVVATLGFMCQLDCRKVLDVLRVASFDFLLAFLSRSSCFKTFVRYPRPQNALLCFADLSACSGKACSVCALVQMSLHLLVSAARAHVFCCVRLHPLTVLFQERFCKRPS